MTTQKPKDPCNIGTPLAGSIQVTSFYGRRDYELRQEIFKFEYGPARRKLLLELISIRGQLHVNRTHCLLTNLDKDLQLLLKKKIIVMKREGSFKRNKPFQGSLSKTTYVEMRR